MEMTIKQLADQIGVSKTAVRKHMDEDFRAKHTAETANGTITISPEGCKLIAEKFQKAPQTIENTPVETAENTVSADIVAILRDTIDTLKLQLEAKDAQIKDLQEQNAKLTDAVKAQAQSINADRHTELIETAQHQLEAPQEKKPNLFARMFGKKE